MKKTKYIYYEPYSLEKNYLAKNSKEFQLKLWIYSQRMTYNTIIGSFIEPQNNKFDYIVYSHGLFSSRKLKSIFKIISKESLYSFSLESIKFSKKEMKVEYQTDPEKSRFFLNEKNFQRFLLYTNSFCIMPQTISVNF